MHTPEPSTPANPPRVGRLVLAVAVCVAVAAAILRVARWWSNQSLWLDEAMVAVNVRDSSYLGLAGNLRFSQSAPLGWLYAERLLVQLFGTDERVLRFLPLLYAIGTIAAAVMIGRRWFGPAGLIALVMSVAAAPMLVRYASEVKQYSSDAFWVITLVGLAAWAADRTFQTRASLLRIQAVWWIAAVIASWQSMAAIIVTPGLALVLVVVAWWAHGRRGATFVVIAGGVWLASFAVHYLAALRYTTSTPYLKGYWRDFGGFPKSYSPIDMARWLARLPGSLAEDPLGITGVVPVTGFWLLVLAGLVVTFRRNAIHGWLLAAPILTGVVLALVQIVPLTMRLALWLVPVLLIAMAAAIDAASSAVIRAWRGQSRAHVLTSALVGALMVGFLSTVVSQMISVARVPAVPYGADDRAAVDWLRQRHQPGDLTLVTISSYPSIAWYDRDKELAPGWYVRGVLPGPDCDPQRAPREVANYQRLIVYSGIQVDTHLMIEAKLVELGRIVEKRFFDLGTVWVVDLLAKSDPSLIVPAAQQEPNNCLALSEF